MVEGRSLLPELREHIRRIERPAAATHGVLPFGIAAIDRMLPGGGLARGALHEILGVDGDEEDGEEDAPRRYRRRIWSRTAMPKLGRTCRQRASR